MNPVVQGQATTFITDAQHLVNELIADPVYWVKPYDKTILFTAEQVVYGIDLIGQRGSTMGWYGQLPQPQFQVTSTGGEVI